MPRNDFWFHRIQIGDGFVGTYKGGPIIIGDSLANNFGNVSAFEQNKFFGHHLINLGIGGDNAQNVLYRFPYYRFTHAAAPFVMLMVGTNNIEVGEDPAVTADRLTAIACKFRAAVPQTRVVMLGVSPRGPFLNQFVPQIDALNALLQARQTANGFVYVDVNRKIRAECKGEQLCHLYKDYTHFNAVVYGWLMNAVNQALAVGG